MKNIFFSFFLICGISLTSCKDDDDSSRITKLPKAITSIESNLSFGYNNKNQLTKVVDKDSDKEYSETIFSYNEEGKLTKFVNAFYESGNVSTETYTIQYLSAYQLKVIDEDNEYTLVTLNEKGQALSFNNLGSITTFSYDVNGNLVKIIDGAATTTASYNNDKGIFSSISTANWVLFLNDFDFQYFSINNPVSITTVIDDNGTSQTYSETYVYPKEHIIAGYPTRMSVNYTENGSTFNEIYSINY